MFGYALPKHVEAQFEGVAALLRQGAELVIEGLVRVGFFMLLERGPIGDDGDVLVGLFQRVDGTLRADEAGIRENLSGDETA
jgi:hypothetical protein